MSIPYRSFTAARDVFVVAGVCATLASCAARRPTAGIEPVIQQAVGSSAPIEFHIEGGPLNEPSIGVDRLSVANALERAVTTDPAVQASLARVHAAYADADQARLLP